MLMPANILPLSPSDLLSLHFLSFQQLLVHLLSQFISPGEVSRAQLTALIARSYCQFHSPTPLSSTSLRELSYTPILLSSRSFIIANLYHGPTLTFKDVALQPLASLLSHFSSIPSSSSSSPPPPLHILVGTSGDTGPAAIEAVASLPNTRLYVLYPLHRISRLQELQMITAKSDNVTVIGVDGSSDDLDIPIKRLFDDRTFNEQHRLCSINSINVTRILCQCAHIFHATLSSAFSSSPVSLSIPSGALGHLVAALTCRLIGLPIRRIVVATNANRCVADLINTGIYRPADAVMVTSSCAMDINAAYNIERLLWIIAKGNQKQKALRVNEGLLQLAEKGEMILREEERDELRKLGVLARSIGETETESTMRTVWKECGVLIDPHTAVGVAAAVTLLTDREEGERVICLSTAHPAKFVEAVSRATRETKEKLREDWLNSISPNVKHTQELEGKPTYSLEWSRGKEWADDWTSKLRTLIEESER